MLEALDGPSKQGVITVSNSTPTEVKIDTSPQEERKVITMQSHAVDDPDYGDFYVYFAEDDSTPSAGDVSTNGFVQSKNALHSYEASYSQHVWVMAVDVSSIKIRVVERA